MHLKDGAKPQEERPLNALPVPVCRPFRSMQSCDACTSSIRIRFRLLNAAPDGETALFETNHFSIQDQPARSRLEVSVRCGGDSFGAAVLDRSGP